MCRLCKYWTYNSESDEHQCWRDDSSNSGTPMDDFDFCVVYIGDNYGFEPMDGLIK